MRAEIVAVGTELLLGDVVNGNAAWLGHELAAIGVDVEQTTVVGDNIERIAEILAHATGRSDVVIVTGGLGPTQDDLTREALARLTGSPLERDPALEAALIARYEAVGRPDFARNNLRMADRPRAAAALPNSSGTAPGLRVEHGDVVLYALPGVPAEMREIFGAWVRDELADRAGRGSVLLSRQLHTVGIWESEVAQLLAEIDAELDGLGNPTLAYLASQGQTLVRITAKAANAADATALIDAVDARVRAALGDVVYGVDDETLESVVQAALARAGATLATAESLTGGLLGAALTTVSGSSTTYRGGVVAYATDAKHSLLGVPAGLLAERGAVDAEVALAMAAGCRDVFGAAYGIATTGVAGPSEQDGKPVGTVFVAIVGPDDAGDGRVGGGAVVRELRLRGDRQRIRQAAVTAALDMVRRLLGGLDQPQ
jgi:competence/damage-inducible protein CinA-like protein